MESFLIVVGVFILLIVNSRLKGRVNRLEDRLGDLSVILGRVMETMPRQSPAAASDLARVARVEADATEPAAADRAQARWVEPYRADSGLAPDDPAYDPAYADPAHDDPAFEESASEESAFEESAFEASPSGKLAQLSKKAGTPESPAFPRAAPEPLPERAQVLASAHSADAAPSGPPELPGWVLTLRRWLFTGNLVAKAGLMILFFGVAFLLKYAAERVTIPIELRLAGVVLADIGLLMWGWKIRVTHRGIGLPVQGAALSILMLVTFAAFRLYQLIPGPLAFGLLFVLTLFTCLLAVLQDAFWLAVFGICGGFLAPILTSSGSANHIGLFSYYAMLGAGIVAIAFKRAWRTLNLIGFGFTFVIGTAWGVLKYAPSEYLSAQLFLILFTVFYTAVALLYAKRQASYGKQYVDATLVFGVPMAAIGLQCALVRGMPFGLAFAAMGAGLCYTTLAVSLWRRGGPNFRLLVEAYIALGVVLGTLAFNFALDERWTSAAWALEGAALVWFGLRQRSRRTLLFGIVVQLGAWLEFSMSWAGQASHGAVDGTLWASFALLAGAAWFMALAIHQRRGEDDPLVPAWAAALFLGVAVLWLSAGLLREILMRVDGALQMDLVALCAVLLAVFLLYVCRRLAWPVARRLSLTVQLAGGAILLVLAAPVWLTVSSATNLFDTPFVGAALMCASAFHSARAAHRTAAEQHTGALSRLLLVWSAAWWYGPVLVTLAAWISMLVDDQSLAWFAACMGIAVALSTVGFVEYARASGWTALRWGGMVSWPMQALFAGAILALLYMDHSAPFALWAGYAALWLAGEYLLERWPASGWTVKPGSIAMAHTLRTVAPWLMIWPAGALYIGRWLGSVAEVQEASGSWARYLPAWVMMLVLVWLVARARQGTWPTRGAPGWHRHVLIPAATAWSLGLAGLWNFTQNGNMEPLPYLPILNPLDLTTGFAMLLGVGCYNMLKTGTDQAHVPAFLAKLPSMAAWSGFVWLNLMLLRSAAHYLHLPYQAEALYGSQFIEAMLSLVWAVSAMVLMRFACGQWATPSRPLWVTGALLLVAVVAKLFLVDLANSGSVERIVSFVGVGLLMVGIGYLAPFPTPPADANAGPIPDPDPAPAPDIVPVPTL